MIKILAFILLLCCASICYGQQRPGTKDSLAQIQTYQQLLARSRQIDSIFDTNRLGTQANMARMIGSQWHSFSGTEVKSGKAFGSSAAIDTKSITVNIALPAFKSELYLLPTIAGSANNGLVTLFSGDKYSRSVTGGINFLLPLDKIDFFYGYDPNTKAKLHNDLKILKTDHYLRSGPAEEADYQRRLGELIALIQQSYHFFYRYYNNPFGDELDTAKITLTAIDNLKKFKADVDTLTSSGILPPRFAQLDSISQIQLLKKDPSQKIRNTTLRHYLDKADQLQQRPIDLLMMSLGWFSGGIKYNQGNYLVADSTAKNLTSSFRDDYLSATFSWNALAHFGSRIRTYFAPTAYYSNPHNFSAANQLHAESLVNYKIGSSTLQKVDKDLTFYQKVPARLQSLYFEIPLAIYDTKKGVGAEFAFKYGFNDINNDNLALRIGALVPLSQGEKNQVVIEPLIRLQKLNQGLSSFWGTNFVFGVNLSITVPKSFFN